MKERSFDNLHESIEHYLNIAGQKIVQRGRAYYRDRNFEAEVEGSDDIQWNRPDSEAHDPV